VVQKPLQDIYTAVLFVTFILIMVMAGVQAVIILDQFGTVSSDISRAGMNTDNPSTPTASVPGYGYNDCEVVHRPASQGSEPSDGHAFRAGPASTETEQDVMGSLYYAVYTCSGVAVVADSYI
jgi:hypothetical protein